MTSRRVVTVLVLALGFAVSGCAASPDAAPSESAPSSAAPTPTPTPTPTPQWTVAYGGDCDVMLTDEQVATILGPGATDYPSWFQEHVEPVAPEAEAPMSPGAEGTAGGLSCTWVAGRDSEGGERHLTVLALPEAVVDPQTAAALATPACDPMYDSVVCRLAAARDGLWVEARMSPMGDDAPPTQILDAAIAGALDQAAQYPAAVAAAPTDERWPIIECEELGRAMALEDILGTGYWSGYWEGSRQHEDDLFEHAGVRQFCQYGTGESGGAERHHIISVTSEPDGAWRWDRIRVAGGDTVSVPGASDAVGTSIPREGEFSHDTIAATDGTNVIHVGDEGGTLAADVAARAIAAFGG